MLAVTTSHFRQSSIGVRGEDGVWVQVPSILQMLWFHAGSVFCPDDCIFCCFQRASSYEGFRPTTLDLPRHDQEKAAHGWALPCLVEGCSPGHRARGPWDTACARLIIAYPQMSASVLTQKLKTPHPRNPEWLRAKPACGQRHATFTTTGLLASWPLGISWVHGKYSLNAWSECKPATCPL